MLPLEQDLMNIHLQEMKATISYVFDDNNEVKSSYGTGYSFLIV